MGFRINELYWTHSAVPPPPSLPSTNYAETERLVGRPTDRPTRRRNGKGRTEREGQQRRQTIGCKWNYLSSPPLPLSFLPFVFLFLSPRRERGTWSVNSPDRREGVTPTGRRLLTQHPPRPIRCTCALRSALPSINAMNKDPLVLFRCTLLRVNVSIDGDSQPE